jgi:hypothetical protein
MGKEIIKIENFNVNALEEIKGKKELIANVIKENPFIKVVDNKTYEDAKKSRTALRTCRTDLEKEEKALVNAVKTKITEPIKSIYSEFKNTITPAEDTQQQEVKSWEDVKEQERQEKIRIEEERKQNHRNNIELFFNLNKIIIEDLTFETIRHELVYSKDEKEFTPESFEEFADVFESKVDVLTTMLNDKINTLQDKENIRLENEKLANERKENERKQKIKNSIDYYYTTWQDLFSDMKFEDIQKLTDEFISEKPLDCAELQEEYAQKRTVLVRVLEAKTNFLNESEIQRVKLEKLEQEKANLELAKKELADEKQRIEELEKEKSLFETKVNTRIKQLINLGLNFDFESSYVGFDFIIDVLDIKTYDDSKWDKLINQIQEIKSKPIIPEPQISEIEVVSEEVVPKTIQEEEFKEEEELSEELKQKRLIIYSYYNYVMDNHDGVMRAENIEMYIDSLKNNH